MRAPSCLPGWAHCALKGRAPAPLFLGGKIAFKSKCSPASSLDGDKRLLCNLRIDEPFPPFMMGCILLTLSGNGFKAQFKHLTAACFKKSREWTEGVRGCDSRDGYCCLGAPAAGVPHTVQESAALWQEPLPEVLRKMELKRFCFQHPCCSRMFSST